MRRRPIYTWIAFVTTQMLLLLLLGFMSIWPVYSGGTSIMSQVGAQRAREEKMVEDVLTIAYRPANEHTKAISELQDILPAWEQTQRGLDVGDTSLGLPMHPPAEISVMLIQSQADYVPMDVAFQEILTHHTPADPVQVQIILAHERAYYLTMSNVNILWQQHIDDVFWQLFDIEAGVIGAIVVVVALNFFLTKSALKKP